MKGEKKKKNRGEKKGGEKKKRWREVWVREDRGCTPEGLVRKLRYR